MTKKSLIPISCIDQITNYLKDFDKNSILPKNSWFEDKNMKVYMRFNAGHYIEGIGILRTMDMASVEVIKKKRGQGIFTKFLSDLVSIKTFNNIYIENVLETRLANFLERNGWILKNKNLRNFESPCFYKIVA